jgi:hypothetical protein
MAKKLNAMIRSNAAKKKKGALKPFSGKLTRQNSLVNFRHH